MREQSWDEYLQVFTARDIEIWQLNVGPQQVLRLPAQFYIHSILEQYNSHSNRHHRYQIRHWNPLLTTKHSYFEDYQLQDLQ